MNLEFLDKSSDITPLLVQLYDTQQLYDLAKDKSSSARTNLSDVVSDLLERKLSMRESELVADVLIEFIRQAEKDLRCVISEHLSVLPNIPLRLALQIVNDEIDVASPFLRRSTALGDIDLAYIIKSHGAEYWHEIAARKSLGDSVMDVLADTRDFDTALGLIENRDIKLTEHTLGVLSDIAQKRDDLAQPLLGRDEITNEIAGDLYAFVGDAIKQQINETYDVDVIEMVDRVDGIVVDLVDSLQSGAALSADEIIRDAELYQVEVLPNIEIITSALRHGNKSLFLAQFAKMAGLSPRDTQELLLRPKGQGLALIARAKGLSKQEFTAIFLLTGHLHNTDEGFNIDVSDITHAVDYYSGLEKAQAQYVLRNLTLNS